MLVGLMMLGTWQVALAPPVSPKAAGSSVRDAGGDLAAYVDAFVDTIPRRDTGGYDVPTSTEVTRMADAYVRLAVGDAAGAASIAGPLSYEVVRYTDTVTGRRVDLLQEKRTRAGTYLHAWGLYGLAAGSTSPLVVEVAHPLADVHTQRQGVVAFRRGQGARALFVAGAHRDANPGGVADVAHQAGSVFHAIHARAVGSGARVYQPHGFGEATYADLDAVVSSGSTPTALTTSVGDALAAGGLRTCVFDGGATCAKLRATANVQGQHTRSVGGEFLHVETVTAVRQDPIARARVAEIVADLVS